MCEQISPSYPLRILPRSGWGKNFHGATLISHTPNALVGHRLDGDANTCIIKNPVSNTMTIEAKFLQSARMRNLSVNLLGGAFKIEDFAFDRKGNGAEDWDTVLDINIANFNAGTDYLSVTSTFCVAGWTLEELEGKRFPFNRKFESEGKLTEWLNALPEHSDDSNIQAYLDEFSKITPSPDEYPYVAKLEAYVKMIHRPTNLNYWHLTLDIFTFDDPENELSKEEANRNYVKKNTLRFIADYLRNNFVIIDSNSPIPEISDWESIAISGHTQL